MACIKTLVWLFIGIVSKVQGYANGLFPEACESMSPVHRGIGGVPDTPQNTKAPYIIFYELGSSLAEPITVVLNTTSTPFRGFMLEARMHESTEDKFGPMGKFIIVEPDKTQLLTCGGSEGTAVSQTTNQQKTSIRVKWINITAEERERNIIFRATVVQSLGMFWECQAGTALMSFDCAVKVVKTEVSNIVTVLFASSSFHHRLSKVSTIMCTILCVALEISSLILFCVGKTSKVSLISLVSAATVVNFTELIIVSLPIRPSHELEEIHTIAVQVCCLISQILALAVVFVGALEVDQFKQSSSESWLRNVLAAFTVWTGLFIVWIVVFNTRIKAILKTRMIGNMENIQTRQQNQETLSPTRVIFIIISTVFIIGTTSFAVAVTVGIFV